MLLQAIDTSTKKYIMQMPKSNRKAIGQFFTSLQTAEYMGNLVKSTGSHIKVLDAGAGSGILAAAVIQRLIKNSSVQKLTIDLYENNPEIFPLLQSNMEHLREEAIKDEKELVFNIITDNFILDNEDIWNNCRDITPYQYDVIISNPPYNKISKGSPEAQMMNSIIYGQPNIYFLFISMAIKFLKPEGEMIFIVPRSWVSGLYFTRFRQYLFSNIKITNLHLFISRDKVFDADPVLQETIIFRAIKTSCEPTNIIITSSESTHDFESINELSIPYKQSIVSDKNSFMYLPTNESDISVLNKVNRFTNTLASMGFKLKTGVTVDFRSELWMRDSPASNTVPLFWAFHFNGGKIQFPKEGAKNQYITTDNPALLMPNSNYVFLKRFSSKEEKRRLQPTMYFNNDFQTYKMISTENHLNFITRIDGSSMSIDEVYGFYIILNSTLWDQYFRLLNGSTQVNANELNSIPFPSINMIQCLGKHGLMAGVYKTKDCDDLLKEYLDD